MTDALRIINAEHGSMWRVLSLLDSLRAELEETAAPPHSELFTLIFDYLSSYADRMHHPKEDDFLFAILRRRDPAAAVLIDELQAEHRRGAELMDELRLDLEHVLRHHPHGRERFCARLRDYIEMERGHINKEEGQLMPLARERLTEVDWLEINRAFADNRDPLFGEESQAEFRELRRRIAHLAPTPHGLGGQARVVVHAPAPAVGAPLLEVEDLTSHYGRIQALRGISLRVRQGELVALVGANGAGKTTLLRTISGLQPASGGRILFQGQDITRLRADLRVRLGITQSPEGRQVFGPLSVEDNLRLGAYSRAKAKAGMAEDLERIYDLFPILREKRRLPAGTLSGGQQQMLAMGRALMGRPRLLLLDEPSMGLAPLLVEEIFSVVRELKRQGMTIFLVEQNAHAALSIADTGYVIETGATVLSDRGPALLANERVKAAYLGI
ncbi:MAG TPA: ATP-binding cassette domain-containing protein [Candidatus Competibacteraceae bacterium]|nr:ATP-binding cassette domain-containing protein [Candidatus Competibacteraceae bacterium]